MMSNDEIDLERLILAIQERPAIWHMRAKDYSDRIKRKRSWEEIVNIFSKENATKKEKQILGTLLQKKWKNARDRYSREVNHRVGKSGQGAKRKAPYMFAAQLSFLEDTIQPRSTSSSMANDELESSQASIDEVDVNEEAEASQILNKNNVSGDNLESSKTKSMNRPSRMTEQVRIGKKRKFLLVEAKLIEALDCNAKRREVKENMEDDADRLFLLSLLPHLKLLPSHLKLSARLDILQAINKYVYQPPITTSPYVQPYPPALHYQQSGNQLHQPQNFNSAQYQPQNFNSAQYQPPYFNSNQYQQPALNSSYLQAGNKITETERVSQDVTQIITEATAVQQRLPNPYSQTSENESSIPGASTPLQSPTDSIHSFFSNYSGSGSDVTMC